MGEARASTRRCAGRPRLGAAVVRGGRRSESRARHDQARRGLRCARAAALRGARRARHARLRVAEPFSGRGVRTCSRTTARRSRSRTAASHPVPAARDHDDPRRLSRQPPCRRRRARTGRSRAGRWSSAASYMSLFCPGRHVFVPPLDSDPPRRAAHVRAAGAGRPGAGEGSLPPPDFGEKRPLHASAKTVLQSSLMLTTVQPSAAAGSSDVLGAGRVGELALGVVVEDEQPQCRAGPSAGVAEHRDVAVRVAAGEDRPAADPAPDPDRLDRTVVEDVRLGRVGDRRRRARRRGSAARSSCRSPARPGSRRSPR